jgi:hypothetical protein
MYTFTVIWRLSFPVRFPTPLFIGMAFSLLISITGLASGLSSLIITEGQEQRQPPYIVSSLDEGSDYPYFGAVSFIQELENLVKNFEYVFDLEANQIFPNNDIKQNIVSEYKSSRYDIDDLNHELLGFKIMASEVEIHVDPKRIDDTKTRIEIPLLLAKDIKVSNGPINLSYNEVDLESVYGIYDKATDKISVHVPVSIAAKYIQH